MKQKQRRRQCTPENSQHYVPILSADRTVGEGKSNQIKCDYNRPSDGHQLYCDGTKFRPTYRGVMHLVYFLTSPIWAWWVCCTKNIPLVFSFSLFMPLPHSDIRFLLKECRGFQAALGASLFLIGYCFEESLTFPEYMSSSNHHFPLRLLKMGPAIRVFSSLAPLPLEGAQHRDHSESSRSYWSGHCCLNFLLPLLRPIPHFP